MTKQSQWKDRQFASLLTGKKIFLLLIFSPGIFYIYKAFPTSKVWVTPFFTFESLYFQDVQAYVWTLMSKLGVIILLSVWFATCKNWWYHAIAVPLGMFIFQFVSLFVLDFEYQDEVDFFFTLPLILSVMLLLYYLRNRIKDNVEIINLQDDVNEELQKFERLDELKKHEKEKRARMGSRDINDLL